MYPLGNGELVPVPAVSNGDNYGFSVAVDGIFAFVGARLLDILDVADAGRVYIFEEGSPGVWAPYQETTFVELAEPAALDTFGEAVAVAGNFAIVGAPGRESFEGRAFIYHRDGTSGEWVFQDPALEPAPPAPMNDDGNDRFGAAVAIQDQGDFTIAVVGAEFDSNQGVDDAGGVYIYVHDNDDPPDVWDLVDPDFDGITLIPPSPTTGINFGTAVALDGDWLIVGACDATGGQPGRFFIYERVAGNWVLDFQFQETGGGSLGDAVAISTAGPVAIAAIADPAEASDGAVYLYELVGGNWTEADDSPLTSPSTTSPDNAFGTSVSIVGNDLVVGAPGAGPTGDPDTGAAFLYERKSSGLWNFAVEANLLPADQDQGDRLGWAAALREDKDLVLGALFDASQGVNATGNSFVFNNAFCSADANGDGLIDVTDLIDVILDWGTAGAGNGGDVTFDGIVNVSDLTLVILGWGACPGQTGTVASLQEEWEDACLLWPTQWNQFMNNIESANWRCWTEFYLEGGCFSPSQPGCPGADPYAR